MNEYESKLEAKRQRYLELAEKAEAESQDAYRRFRQIGDMIPMGQPILVGHHSEKRHRRDIGRMDAFIRKSVEADKKAAYYRAKAAGVGRGGISSDDPDAAVKLEQKIKKAKDEQEMMKAANRVIRKAAKAGNVKDAIPDLVELGLSERTANAITDEGLIGGYGFAQWQLKNNLANIKRMEKRLTELRAAADREDVEKDLGDEVVYKEEDNRVQFVFPDKPDAEVRALLKRNGFKWSPSRGAWVRMLNNAGRYKAQVVAKELGYDL